LDQGVELSHPLQLTVVLVSVVSEQDEICIIMNNERVKATNQKRCFIVLFN